MEKQKAVTIKLSEEMVDKIDEIAAAEMRARSRQIEFMLSEILKDKNAVTRSGAAKKSNNL